MVDSGSLGASGLGTGCQGLCFGVATGGVGRVAGMDSSNAASVGVGSGAGSASTSNAEEAVAAGGVIWGGAGAGVNTFGDAGVKGGAGL